MGSLSLALALPAFAVWVQRFCCVYYMSCVLLRARMHEALTLIAIYNDRVSAVRKRVMVRATITFGAASYPRLGHMGDVIFCCFDICEAARGEFYWNWSCK
jgi:hypothetical protein